MKPLHAGELRGIRGFLEVSSGEPTLFPEQEMGLLDEF